MDISIYSLYNNYYNSIEGGRLIFQILYGHPLIVPGLVALPDRRDGKRSYKQCVPKRSL